MSSQTSVSPFCTRFPCGTALRTVKLDQLLGLSDTADVFFGFEHAGHFHFDLEGFLLDLVRRTCGWRRGRGLAAVVSGFGSSWPKLRSTMVRKQKAIVHSCRPRRVMEASPLGLNADKTGLRESSTGSHRNRPAPADA